MRKRKWPSASVRLTFGETFDRRCERGQGKCSLASVKGLKDSRAFENKMKRSPGRYQELDLFIKVLRLLCPNLTDAMGGRGGTVNSSTITPRPPKAKGPPAVYCWRS